MVSMIASLASVEGRSFAAVSTAKDVLTMLGILKKQEDPWLVLLKQINEEESCVYLRVVRFLRFLRLSLG
jgi:hypothetical protein